MNLRHSHYSIPLALLTNTKTVIDIDQGHKQLHNFSNLTKSSSCQTISLASLKTIEDALTLSVLPLKEYILPFQERSVKGFKNKDRYENRKCQRSSRNQTQLQTTHTQSQTITHSKMFNFQTNSSSFRLFLLGLMVLQNSSVVLVGRYTRDSKAAEDLYVVNHLIIVTEVMKFIFSTMLEYKLTNGELSASIKKNIIDVPLDALKIAIPSMLYLLQNTLLYVALSNLSAPMFQVTYQSKLLTTALVSVIMLQRRYSFKQWGCLAALGFGVSIVVLGASDKKDVPSEGEPEQSLTTGLTAVTVACFSSALAGVYFEKVLKTSTSANGETKKPVSMWMRNMQMAFFSVIIALINGYRMTGRDAEVPFMHGFSVWVWVVVFLQAGGGLLVAAVIKYADNVLKGMATGVSVVTSTACSMVLFKTPLTMQFFMGAVIILISVFFFSNDLPGSKKKVVPETPESKGSDVEMNKPLMSSSSS
jgi:UDP-sugar transporter A1/2/3